MAFDKKIKDRFKAIELPINKNKEVNMLIEDFEQLPKIKKVEIAKASIKKDYKPEKEEIQKKLKKVDEFIIYPTDEIIDINVTENGIIQKNEKQNKEVFKKSTKKEKKQESKVPYVRTIIDKLLVSIQDNEKSINELSKELNASNKKIEEWGLDLQAKKIVEVKYPRNLLQSPRIKLVKKLEPRKFQFSNGKAIGIYNFESDNIPVTVRVLSLGTNTPVYEVLVPIIGEGTEAIINNLTMKISEDVNVTSEELSDPRMMELLKQKFMNNALEKIENKIPGIDEKTKKILAGLIIHKMYGLKDIEFLMSDDLLEEITINGSNNPIAVYHRKHAWCMTNLKVNDEEEILNLSSSIGRKVGKTISIMNPLMDAHLITGDRVQATLFPISGEGNTITIRKFSKNPWTLTQYLKSGTINTEIAAFLWLCMQYELSIMIGGGTASGKTSCLNSLTALIPPNQRIITIEDIREISLPKMLEWNWVPLTVREARNEEKSNITMLELMVSSLRMRPDRIIVGEVRKKKQAEVLFEAIHTGHAVYATVHADNAEQAFVRLTEEPISIPMIQLEGLQLILIMFRDRRTGIRRLIQVAELMPIPGEVGQRKVNINLLYRWTPKEDKWDKLQNSERVINEIAMRTGLTEENINKDLKEKKEILQWMVRHEVFNINDFGKVMDAYYRNPKSILEFAKKNSPPGALL